MLPPLLPHFSRMLHRLLDAKSGVPVASGGVSDGVRSMAQELYELLSDKVSAAVLLRHYAAEQERVASTRLARRRTVALAKVLDPEGAQRRRDKKNAMRRRQRQRKQDNTRVRTGRGVKRGLR